MISILALLVSLIGTGSAGVARPSEATDDPWGPLFEELAEGPTQVQRAALVARYADQLGSRKLSAPQQEGFRRIARVALGLEAGPLNPAALPADLTGAAAWVAHTMLEDPAARASTLGWALAGVRSQDPWTAPLLVAAYEEFVRAEGAFEGPRALEMAEGCWRLSPAIWSLFCYEGALRRTGSAADAAALLGSFPRPEVREERRDVWGREAIAHRGAGARGMAVGVLGAALGAGSPDGAQMLGIDALLRGERRSAAEHFGALLHAATLQGRAPAPWAQRGFGVALLPPAR